MIEASSQSQQSEQQQKFLDENKEHTQEVLLKGKEILPDYSEESLLQIYKRYFQVDQVFFNELNIIAKRKSEVTEDDGWVTIKTKEKAPRRNQKKYNFLHDERLIWRANNWDKEQAKIRNGQGRNRLNKDREQNKNLRFKQKQEKQQENKKQQQKSRKFEEKKNNRRGQNNEEVKQKYTEKEENNNSKQNQKKFQGKEANKGNKSRKEEGKQKKNNRYRQKVDPVTKYQEKKDPEPEKVQQKSDLKVEASSSSNNQIPVQNAAHLQSQPAAQPKTQQKQKPVPVPPPAKIQQVKKQEPIKQNKQRVSEPIKVQNPSKPESASEKKVQQPKKETVRQLPTQTVSIKKQAQQIQPVKEQKPVPIVLDKQTINKNFTQSTKKYTKILKFIKPGEKVQKISYVWNNGSIDSVKVHVPLN